MLIFGCTCIADIETSLATKPGEQQLSPFELAMVSDLLIQIAMHKCPLVSRPGVRSMKQYIFTTFTEAPKARVAHPLFYSNYRNLVQCLSYLEEHSPMKSQSRIYEAVSDTGKGRRKRETAEESVEEVNDLIPQQKESSSTLDNLKSTSEVPKLQPFELLFVGLQNLAEKTCPIGLLNSHFISRSVAEIIDWIHSHNLVLHAVQKYSNKVDIFGQFAKCFKETQNESFTVNK